MRLKKELDGCEVTVVQGGMDKKKGYLMKMGRPGMRYRPLRGAVIEGKKYVYFEVFADPRDPWHIEVRVESTTRYPMDQLALRLADNFFGTVMVAGGIDKYLEANREQFTEDKPVQARKKREPEGETEGKQEQADEGKGSDGDDDFQARRRRVAKSRRASTRRVSSKSETVR